MRSVSLTLVLTLVTTPALAHKEDPDTEVARKHFETGRIHYDRGDYEKALESFERAKRVKPAAAFDFNIGRCLDRLERYEEAIASYQRYVMSLPTPEDADEVRSRIMILKERLASAPPPRVAPPPPPSNVAPTLLTLPEEPKVDPELERKRKNRRTAAIVAGVIVGSLVVGGAIAAGLLIKNTTEPNTPATLGIWPGTN